MITVETMLMSLKRKHQRAFINTVIALIIALGCFILSLYYMYDHDMLLAIYWILVAIFSRINIAGIK